MSLTSAEIESLPRITRSVSETGYKRSIVSFHAEQAQRSNAQPPHTHHYAKKQSLHDRLEDYLSDHRPSIFHKKGKVSRLGVPVHDIRGSKMYHDVTYTLVEARSRSQTPPENMKKGQDVAKDRRKSRPSKSRKNYTSSGSEEESGFYDYGKMVSDERRTSDQSDGWEIGPDGGRRRKDGSDSDRRRKDDSDSDGEWIVGSDGVRRRRRRSDDEWEIGRDGVRRRKSRSKSDDEWEIGPDGVRRRKRGSKSEDEWEIGPDGVRRRKKGAKSEDEWEIGSDGVRRRKRGSKSEDEWEIGPDGVRRRKRGSKSEDEWEIGPDGVRRRKKGTKSEDEWEIGPDGVRRRKRGSKTEDEWEIGPDGIRRQKKAAGSADEWEIGPDGVRRRKGNTDELVDGDEWEIGTDGVRRRKKRMEEIGKKTFFPQTHPNSKKGIKGSRNTEVADENQSWTGSDGARSWVDGSKTKANGEWEIGPDGIRRLKKARGSEDEWETGPDGVRRRKTSTKGSKTKNCDNRNSGNKGTRLHKKSENYDECEAGPSGLLRPKDCVNTSNCDNYDECELGPDGLCHFKRHSRNMTECNVRPNTICHCNKWDFGTDTAHTSEEITGYKFAKVTNELGDAVKAKKTADKVRRSSKKRNRRNKTRKTSSGSPMDCMSYQISPDWSQCLQDIPSCPICHNERHELELEECVAHEPKSQPKVRNDSDEVLQWLLETDSTKGLSIEDYNSPQKLLDVFPEHQWLLVPSIKWSAFRKMKEKKLICKEKKHVEVYGEYEEEECCYGEDAVEIDDYECEDYDYINEYANRIAETQEKPPSKELDDTKIGFDPCDYLVKCLNQVAPPASNKPMTSPWQHKDKRQDLSHPSQYRAPRNYPPTPPSSTIGCDDDYLKSRSDTHWLSAILNSAYKRRPNWMPTSERSCKLARDHQEYACPPNCHPTYEDKNQKCDNEFNNLELDSNRFNACEQEVEIAHGDERTEIDLCRLVEAAGQQLLMEISQHDPNAYSKGDPPGIEKVSSKTSLEKEIKKEDTRKTSSAEKGHAPVTVITDSQRKTDESPSGPSTSKPPVPKKGKKGAKSTIKKNNPN